MISTLNKLFLELENELSNIEQENDILLKRSELSFYACKNMLEKLKALIIKYKFKNEAEEIKFFKEIKPLFTSRQVYHLMLYNIETRKPNGGKDILKKYFTKELEKLKHYFDYNIDFYKYHRSGATYLDHKYFVRDKFDIQLTLDGHIFEHDTRFSTTHDFKVAKVLAHDRLQVHIENEIGWLESRDSSYIYTREENHKLTWTDSKTSLIELIYALHAHGAFDNGRADIKEIASYFEMMFNIDLGEIYRTYLEIRARKSGRTKFITTLQEKLIKRMDEQDGK